MLWNEFETAYLSVNHNNPSLRCSLVCSAAVKEAVQTVYRSRKGDSLFTGSDRHRRCAMWVRDNQATVIRLAGWIAKQEQRRRWSSFRAFAEKLCSEVLDGTTPEWNAKYYLKCATNLTLGEF